VQIRREGLEHAPQGAPLHPALEPAMTGLIRRIAIREVFPRRAGAEDPEDPIEDVSRIAPRPAALIATETGLRQEWREYRPLRVSEVHAVEYDGHRNFVHTPASGFMR
jgi:hypothetical protein